MPGKAFVAIAAKIVGQTVPAYKDLIVAALTATDGPLAALGTQLEGAFKDLLPDRTISWALANSRGGGNLALLNEAW